MRDYDNELSLMMAINRVMHCALAKTQNWAISIESRLYWYENNAKECKICWIIINKYEQMTKFALFESKPMPT